MAVRPTQGGSAIPVSIVSSENASGQQVGGASINDLQFNPVGAHSDGLGILTAQTLVNPPGATKLLIQALTQNVRFTLDGTTPTASSGFQLKAGDPPTIIPLGPNTVVTVIQEAATADLQYQFGS